MTIDIALARNADRATTMRGASKDLNPLLKLVVLTCADHRVDPTHVLGLEPSEAIVIRNPGGRVTDQVLVALVLGVTLLKVDRVLIIEHTRCAMASASEDELRRRVGKEAGTDGSGRSGGVIDDQTAGIRGDVAKVKAHPLISDHVAVGGFIYDVDSGLLTPVD